MTQQEMISAVLAEIASKHPSVTPNVYPIADRRGRYAISVPVWLRIIISRKAVGEAEQGPSAARTAAALVAAASQGKMTRPKGRIYGAPPTRDEFQRGYLAFRERESRDAMYRTAIFLVRYFWGKPAETANGLGVLLLTWNQSLYRYGSFDFQLLEETITANQEQLTLLRGRDIFSYAPAEDTSIRQLFNQFLAALAVCEGSKKGARSPVAVAKALHPLAPDFFPLWDTDIANAYGCSFRDRPDENYVDFVRRMKHLAEYLTSLGVQFGDAGESVLKVIDEYNYAKHTKGWV
jgi:hypothetical protein